MLNRTFAGLFFLIYNNYGAKGSTAERKPYQRDEKFFRCMAGEYIEKMCFLCYNKLNDKLESDKKTNVNICSGIAYGCV